MLGPESEYPPWLGSPFPSHSLFLWWGLGKWGVGAVAGCVGIGAVGLGWVEFQLAPKAVSHCLCDFTSPERLGPNFRLSCLTAAQTADGPQTPPRR